MWSVMLVIDVKSSKFLHVNSVFRIRRSLPFREHMYVFYDTKTTYDMRKRTI